MIPRKKSPKWAFQKNRKRIRRKGVKYVSTPIPGNVRKNIPIKHIIAPRNFSLLESRFEIIEFLRNIEEETQKGKYFSINLKGIKATDALTVSLLITIMMDSKTHIRRVVIPPKNSPARDIFEKANFRGTVTAKNLDKNYFMSRTDMKVNQKFTEEIIEFAKNRGVVDAEEVLNPILVEIFSNTNNHASIDDAIKVPWFISIAEQEEKLCFSVIDLGIGIYESA